MSRWFSARELAALALPDMPTERARASNWIFRLSAQSPDLVRPRKGRGGGLEISEAALPDAARAELQRRASVELLTPSGAQALADAREADRRQMAVHAVGDLTERQRRVMYARQAVLMSIDTAATAEGIGRDRAIRALLAGVDNGTLEPHQAETLRTANDRARDSTLSIRTIYRWFQAFDELGIVALAPKLTREKQDQPAWFKGFLACYAKPSKPSVTEALREFTRTLPEGAVAPTERQVRTCLGKMPLLAKLKGREGQLALRSRLAYTARDFSTLLPTSVYSADGKTFDAEIAHPIHGQPFRPEITTIIDVATRRVVGFSVDLDENTFAVLDALRRACATSGIPAIFYTDRGPGYRNKAMDAPLTGFLARIGTTAMRALPYNSQAKGVIERLNQVYTAAAKSLPTYIGADMDKQAKLAAFKATRRDLKQFGTSRLLPSWEAFLAVIDAALTAYNSRPHSSLPKIHDPQLSRSRHMSPDELWAEKCQGFEPIIPDEQELTDMFRPYVTRKARRSLVEFNGNQYFATALQAFEDQQVVVGYDFRDATRVWVRDIEEIDGERVPGRLIAVAAFNGHKTRYVPHSAEQAAIERRAKGRMGRLQSKMDVVELELRPGTVFDLTAAKPEPFPEILPSAALSAAASEATGIASDPDARPVFADDVSFARWLALHPADATASDKELLRDLLTTHSSKELLRMSGVDLEALRNLLRSAA